MLVSEMMTAKPYTIHQDQPLRRAMEIMENNHFHHLPVINTHNQLVGIITERDCLAALNLPRSIRDLTHMTPTRKASAAPASARTPVRSVMTPAPIVVEPEAEADEAVRLMLNNHVGCLPVMRSETLVGIITTSDVMIAFMALYKRFHDLYPAEDP